MIPFVREADPTFANAHIARGQRLINHPLPRRDLVDHLALTFGNSPAGKDGALALISQLLDHSVNTWNQGFMDKLYSGTNPVGSRLGLSSSVA